MTDDEIIASLKEIREDLAKARALLVEQHDRLANAVEVLSAAYAVLSQHDLLGAEHQKLGDAILAVIL